MMNVKIICTEIIKPSSPTPDHLRCLPHSVFSAPNSEKLAPMVFFFRPKKDDILTVHNVMARLKASFPNTLSMFYPLAGRVQGSDHILCNDEGVPYIEAQVTDTCLEDLVHKADIPQLDLLLPHGSKPFEGYTNLLLAIQTTAFPCGGVAIGVKMNHVIADAFSKLMFVKAWAATTKSESPVVPRPYFELRKVFPPRQQVGGSDPSVKDDKQVAKRFLFTQAKLEALRSELYAKNDSHTGNNDYHLPSLPMILSAFIWYRIKLAQAERGIGDGIPYEGCYLVNIRAKISAPKNQYYFGSLNVTAMAKPSISQGESNGKKDFKSLCHDFIDGVKKWVEKIVGDDAGFVKKVVEGKEDLRYITEHDERKYRGEIMSIGFSNLRSLPVYEADFGWGKPVWVTTATQPWKNFVVLIPAGPSSKDIEAYLRLSEGDMGRLESDTEFVSLICGASCKL